MTFVFFYPGSVAYYEMTVLMDCLMSFLFSVALFLLFY